MPNANGAENSRRPINRIRSVFVDAASIAARSARSGSSPRASIRASSIQDA